MCPKAIAALIALIVVIGPIPTAFGGEGSRYLYISTYVFDNRGDEAFNLTGGDATIPLFQDNSWQLVAVYNSTHAFRPDTDVDGNRIAILDLPPAVPPRSRFTFSIAYEIESFDRPRPEIDPAEADPPADIPPGLVEEFCVETETFTAGDEEVRALARRLAAGEVSVLDIVNRLLEWIIENVSYSYCEVPRYPNETIAEGRGDCDDQAILLVTMCRALGIPALLQVGVVFHEGIEGERTSWGDHLHVKQRGVGWHGWALVYIPPWGWLPIEMTMLTSRDPLTRITEAPAYERHVVTCFNVSRQAYIGDSRRSRELLMSSELYITVSDRAVRTATDTVERSVPTDESPSGMRPPYLILGLCVASVAVVIVVFLWMRRARIVEEKML